MAKEYIEIKANKKKEGYKIKFFHLDSYEDIREVANAVRHDNLAIISVKKIREKSMIDLKRTIDKMKKISEEIGGSVSGLDKNWVCLTPYNVKVSKLVRV